METPVPREGIASCCHALVLPRFTDLESMRRWFANGLPFNGGQTDAESFRFLKALVALPERWEDWPEASRLACPVTELGTAQRYRCNLIGPDGLCSIYGRRTYVCSQYQPDEEACRTCRWFQDGKCAPEPLQEKLA